MSLEAGGGELAGGQKHKTKIDIRAVLEPFCGVDTNPEWQTALLGHKCCLPGSGGCNVDPRSRFPLLSLHGTVQLSRPFPSGGYVVGRQRCESQWEAKPGRERKRSKRTNLMASIHNNRGVHSLNCQHSHFQTGFQQPNFTQNGKTLKCTFLCVVL